MRLVETMGLGVTPSDGEAPDVVRERLSRLFERDEFVRSKGWWQRFLEWLESLLGTPDLDAPSPPAAGGASGLVQLLVWIVIGVLVVGLLALIVTVILRRGRRDRIDEPAADVLVDTSEPTARQWRSMAEQFEAAGEWKEAIRCRYRELVVALVHLRAVPAVPGRTTGELRLDVRRSSPSAASSFDEATLLFELPWYADAETGSPQNLRFRELAAQTLSGAREGDTDDSELLVLAGSGRDDVGDRVGGTAPRRAASGSSGGVS